MPKNLFLGTIYVTKFLGEEISDDNKCKFKQRF